MSNLSVNNVHFGMKLPTEEVLELAANRGLRDVTLNRNVENIHKLINNKTDLYDCGSIEIFYVLQKVANTINKQFPQLGNFVKRIENIQEYSLFRNIEIDNIISDAEKQVGKILDVSTESIEKSLGLS